MLGHEMIQKDELKILNQGIFEFWDQHEDMREKMIEP